MLGKTPLVSMSDKRLGGIENSSFRYFCAMWALESSTSRRVSPSFSRRVRRLLPAGSMGPPLELGSAQQLADIIAGRLVACHELCDRTRLCEFVTKSEHALSSIFIAV